MNIETGIVQVGKFQLRYHAEGKGPIALVIGGSIYYPRIFSQNLRNSLRLVFVDHKGFVLPDSTVDISEYDFEIILDDIERVRDQLNLGRIIIIGHSGNAFMALEYAKKYPEHVSHVVMLGTGPSFSDINTQAVEQYWQESVWPERKAALEQNLKRYPDALLNELTPGQRFIANYIRLGPKIWFDFNFDSSPLWANISLNMPMIDHVWGVVFRDIDITQGLENFNKPVFLGLGRYDFIVAPPNSWDTIRPKFKNITVRVFEHSGHTPPYEEPNLFDQELLAWLSQNS